MKSSELFHCPTRLPSPERSFPELFLPSQLGQQELEGFQTRLRAKTGGGALRCPSHPQPFLSPFSPRPCGPSVSTLDSASRAEKRRVATFIFPLEVLPATPGLCGGSGSTSQPLLLQCLAFSLGFCLQCGSLSRCYPPPLLILCSLCPLHWSLARGSEWGSKYLVPEHCLCSSVFVHTSKNICVCCAWHLSHHLHLPPRYPACFCRLRR